MAQISIESEKRAPNEQIGHIPNEFVYRFHLEMTEMLNKHGRPIFINKIVIVYESYLLGQCKFQIDCLFLLHFFVCIFVEITAHTANRHSQA